MKLMWTGTDVFMLNNWRKRKLLKRPYWIVFRILVKFLDRTMIEGHVTNSELLKKELEEFGFKKKIELMLTPLNHIFKYPKAEHTPFNVLYYKPPRSDLKFRDWLYGIDLIERLRKEYSYPVLFTSVDGGDDMSRIYPLIDFYVRPNRHDGNSRMTRECDVQEIPYYWSNENPDYDEMKKALNEAIKKSRKV